MSEETTQLDQAPEVTIPDHQDTPEPTLADSAQGQEIPSDTGTPSAGPEEWTEEKIEAEARAKGWNPDFEPSKPWQRRKTALEFLQYRADREPIHQLETGLKEREAYIKKLEDKLKQQQEITQKNFQKIEEEQRERALTNVRQAQKRAVEAGDVDGWERLRKREEQILKQESKFKAPEAEAKPEQAPSETEVSPAMQAFLQNNTWYNDDPDLRDYADYLGGKLQKKGYTGEALLSEVSRVIRIQRPDKFQGTETTQRRARTTVNDTDTPAPGGSRNQSLPPAAQREMQKYVAESLSKGRYKTEKEARQAFLQAYNE